MTAHLKKTYERGNTWLICQNMDVVLKDYDGPLMPNMYVMFQTKSKVAMKNGNNSYGIDRWIMKITKLDGDSGEFKATIVLASEQTQDSGDDSDCVSETDEVIDIPTEGKIEKEVLFVDYPTHRRGVMQVYTRIKSDPTFCPSLLGVDDDGEAVKK